LTVPENTTYNDEYSSSLLIFRMRERLTLRVATNEFSEKLKEFTIQC